MYNAEKYLSDTLDSILAQTFQDFEVILVNDCSTDNSRQIAESYLDKFGGRLKIFDNEKNSGPGATRNRGLIFSRGKYIFFMDSDDLLLAYALEEMYELTEKYDDADFFNFTKIYILNKNETEVRTVRWTPRTVPNLIIEENNLSQRVERLKHGWTNWTIYLRFIKRDFLLKNNLFFPENINVSEDRIFTYGLFLCAKKIVQLPKAYILYRNSVGSLSRTRRTALQMVNLRLRPIINGVKWVDNAISKVDFFKQNPQSRFEILESVVAMFFKRGFNPSLSFQQSEIYASIIQEFGESLSEHDVLVAQLCTFVNTQQKKIATLEEKIATLEEQLKAK